MSTDQRTSKSLKGLYGVLPTMKILPTQPMINISMEEMDTTVSEHSVGFHSLLFPPWGTWPEQVTAPGDHAAIHAPCCSGGGYGTDPKEA